MKIKVIYPHHVDFVDAVELDQLISSGKIMAFEREHKLVFIGIHPVRRKRTEGFLPERRGSGRTTE